MKAHVDEITCIGCGLCTSICPSVFELNDEGKSHSIVDVVPDTAEENAKEAESSCPVNAISVS